MRIILIVIAVIFCIGTTLLSWCCCCVAGDTDRQMEREYEKQHELNADEETK